jgi:diguanylate cyclase (GGDEF)-like protein
MKLRNQLFALISALFMAVLVVVFMVSVSGTRQYLEQQLASHAQDAATAMSVTLGQSLAKGDLVLAQAQVASVFDRGFFKSVEVLGPDKSMLVRKALPLSIEGVPAWFVARFPIDTPAGEAFIGSGWKQLGKVLVVSQPTMAYQHLWNTSVDMLAWLLAICAGALALAQFVLQLILKPLHAIEKTAIDVQAKRFGQITDRPAAPELARVVLAMNQMSRRVGEMLDAETAKAAALHKQAYEDEMTGLVNRRGYELRLADLFQGEHQFASGAVIAVEAEVDDMRMLQREHGFAAGDTVLNAIVQCARALFAAMPHTLLARSNEFSFSFVMVDVPNDKVAALAAELQRQIAASVGDGPAGHMVSISIGVAFFHQQDKRTAVFARADLALESARQSGRNGLHVLADKPDDNSALGSSGWRTLIQTALVENRWRVLRQPVMSLAEPQRVMQAECMARLVDSQGALVPAANFMPMAARHRLMPEVDRAMVTLAFDYLKTGTADQGMVAINLSPQSMSDPEFMDWFAAKLAALDHALGLAIEVSEFGALRNVTAAARVRDLVRARQGKFGIDHFGLDPQALQLLRELLPDYVKLAGTLMAELEAVESVSDMLRSFVTLAHSLDVAVIAQQVERVEQLAVLNAAKVDAGQGYYFGAPQ